MNKKWSYTAISVASLVAFIGFWYLVTEVFKAVSPMIVPSPRTVLRTFFAKLGDPNPDGAVLLAHIWASLQVALSGFFLGSLIGIPLGVAMAWFPRFDMLSKPLFDLLRPIPPIAWIPLMILWFGIGVQAKAGVIFLSAFIPCVINAYSGIRQTSSVHIWVARTFGATHWEILWKVAVPTAIPSIFTGMRISLGLAWTSLVAAELLAAVQGLGFMIQVARMLGRPDIIIVGMLTIGAIGAILAFLLELLERSIIKDGR